MQARHRCAGVLVNSDTVISAAHCATHALVATENGAKLTVGFGQVSQLAMDEQLREPIYLERLGIKSNLVPSAFRKFSIN